VEESVRSRPTALVLVFVLASCSAGEGTQGPPGPAGGSGNADPAQVVLNGTDPQDGSLNLTGSATVGSLVAPVVQLGPGPSERLDATVVGALTAGGNADAYHVHDASALTGTLASSALPPDVPRLAAGKLAVEVLPASVPLLDGSGRLPEATIPASLARTADVYSRAEVDSSFLPATAAADFARNAEVYSRTQADATFLPATSAASVAAADDFAVLSSRVTALESAGASARVSQSAASVAPGQCVAVSHGWNTTSVAVAAWERRAGRTLYVPVVAAYDDGTADAARAAAVTVTSGDATKALAVDGDPTTQWESTGGFSWLTLDFGRPRYIGEVRIRPSRIGSGYSTDVFSIGTSMSSTLGIDFIHRASGSCVLGSNCDQLQTFTMAVTARYLRIDVQAPSVPTLADVEVYGEYAAISAGPNAVTVCNYDLATKDLAVLVTR
jgi:hypothetical protein